MLPHRRPCRAEALPVAAAVLATLALAWPGAAAVASPASAVNLARQAVCAPAARAPLSETRAADLVADRLLRGESLHSALALLPARPRYASSLHLVGIRDDHSIANAVAARFCRDLREPRLREVGVATSSNDLWIVVLAPLEVPAPGDQAAVGREVLARVNAARASGYRCGGRSYAPAPPVSLSSALSRVALRHSVEMAESNSLEHEGRNGSTPADRVRDSGYGAALVGENIAGGVPTAAEVVAGWLASPGHCANIMDRRFTEMGLAFAVEPESSLAIYWTQDFALPH